jgi:hypothetical protein
MAINRAWTVARPRAQGHPRMVEALGASGPQSCAHWPSLPLGGHLEPRFGGTSSGPRSRGRVRR